MKQKSLLDLLKLTKAFLKRQNGQNLFFIGAPYAPYTEGRGAPYLSDFGRPIWDPWQLGVTLFLLLHKK